MLNLLQAIPQAVVLTYNYMMGKHIQISDVPDDLEQNDYLSLRQKSVCFSTTQVRSSQYAARGPHAAVVRFYNKPSVSTCMMQIISPISENMFCYHLQKGLSGGRAFGPCLNLKGYLNFKRSR
jgi:hypothetical protein